MLGIAPLSQRSLPANNEWPLAKGASANNPALAAMAPKGFKADSLPITDIGSQVNAVQRLLDQVNFR
ncbi:MAG: hypothetical protein R3317_07480 [Burkholderiaceae bacterium]|nr:hypothetical protein [Burkholderiaceae bacterium]